jgi:hypothetical protein
MEATRPLSTETTYINGGVTNGLIKLFMEGGYVPTDEERLTMEAHETMPRGVEYTETELKEAKERLRIIKRNRNL